MPNKIQRWNQSWLETSSGAFLHRHAEGFDQPAVLHAGRTGGFTSAAIEAEIQVPAHLRCQLEPAIGHGPHQVDSPAGTVVLVA